MTGSPRRARRGDPRDDDPRSASIRAVSNLDTLGRRLRDGAVVTDAATLRERAIDCWSLSLLRRARGYEKALPAAVVFPGSTEDVAAVLAWAATTTTRRRDTLPPGTRPCEAVPA